MLEIENVQIFLEDRLLFDPITLGVRAGEIATVMGPSGCGKSTLLAAVGGSLDSMFRLSGTITLNGISIRNLPIEKRHIGVLFQDDLLFPHLDVFENLAFAVPREGGRSERESLVLDALKCAELSGFEKRDVFTLSGGQKARVSLLRTLLAKPHAVLLDEPFSKLDERLRMSFKDFVKEQVEKMNIPALLVTHDEADVLGDQVVLLKPKRM